MYLALYAFCRSLANPDATTRKFSLITLIHQQYDLARGNAKYDFA